MSAHAEPHILHLEPVKPPTLNFLPIDFFNPQDMNYFMVLFYVLLTAMTIRQNTVLTESKQLTALASLQNRLNKADGNIKFSFLPKNAKTATINAVQDANEEYAAEREDIQNSLITARQTSEVMMTQTSTNVDILQQDATENSGWLQTLNTIFQVIDEMTQR